MHKIFSAMQTTEVEIENLGMCLMLAVLMWCELSRGDNSRCVVSPGEEAWMEKPFNEIAVGAFPQHSPTSSLNENPPTFPKEKQLPVAFLFWRWAVSQAAFHPGRDAF